MIQLNLNLCICTELVWKLHLHLLIQIKYQRGIAKIGHETEHIWISLALSTGTGLLVVSNSIQGAFRESKILQVTSRLYSSLFYVVIIVIFIRKYIDITLILYCQKQNTWIRTWVIKQQVNKALNSSNNTCLTIIFLTWTLWILVKHI